MRNVKANRTRIQFTQLAFLSMCLVDLVGCTPGFKAAGSTIAADTEAGDAVAADILAGKKAFVKGEVVVGSAVNQGALNLNTNAIPASSGGFYSNVVLALSASSVCLGNSIFGAAGAAICNSVFSDLTASNMNRNLTTAQMTLSTETNTSSYAAGYREVPNALQDDDGFFTSDIGCGGSGGSTDTCTSISYATRPGTDCGSSGTIAARITNCAAANGSAATWEGAVKATNGEATWKLVTRKIGAEVWRDERTKLLWSDVGGTYNWCQASGNKQADDPSAFCNNATYQNQTNPYSACAEFTGAQSPNTGDNYAVAGTYADMKGGMGASSSPAVRWRLPTRSDFMQAEIDGVRYVLPNLVAGHWSATIYSLNRDFAWTFDGSNGSWANGNRYDGSSYGPVRCVGR